MNRHSQARRPTELLEQQRAVWDYLDALLSEIPGDDPTPVMPETSADVASSRPVTVTERQPEVPETPEVRTVEPSSEPEEAGMETEAPAEGCDERVEALAATATEMPAADAVEAEPEASGESAVPAWATPDFQALLFEVGALRLAVPLVKLHSVVNLSGEDITPMPNQPDWYLGLMRYRDRNVRVVDTAAMVLPANRRDEAAEAEPRHVLVVGDGAWGLACHNIGEVLKLGEEDVKWRTTKGRRPWLAGTVLGHLCALVDTEAFADMPGGR